MTGAALSDTVRRFLTEDVGSVERLSLLLFLRLNAARWWAAPALAAELELQEDATQSHLEHLGARNLLDVRIVESVVYCYKPAREELSRLVEDLARAHHLHPDAVVEALRRSTDSARLFADAFQLRKGKRHG